ncbi:MAG: sugar phosphate nucleotidyltransferase [Bacteroidota bacterium]
MKLIIPMAGRGTRVRPHSHVTPKPLLPVKGNSMIGRIVDTFARIMPTNVDESVFVLGPDFPDSVRKQLTEVCDARGIKASFAVQEVALGTGHAVFAAEEYMQGDGIVAFADALFDFEDAPDVSGADVVAFVKFVEDPSAYGVAVREGEQIVAFVEKPDEPISNEALIGIYYVQDLGVLRDKLAYIINEDIRGKGGEYQLTDAMDLMLKDGMVFKTAQASEWMDCGTIPALLDTTQAILAKESDSLRHGTVENSVIHEPVYIGPGAVVKNAVVGPNVSMEAGASIENAVVQGSILFADAQVKNAVLDGTLVGRNATVTGQAMRANIGDHSTIA